jgi:uncharacterized paraquat-inducible protein A
MSLEVIVDHVCPRCNEKFNAPVYLADTLCPECFGEAYSSKTKTVTRWQPPLLSGIMCLTGAILLVVWTLFR